ncbi:YhcN/YlaJ family sporulation lipoprotein [Metabacillus endolithicus]|uniref:YhcN/YlaJ family sporulation lipoprotein n=1 Tax=Metabacillus endolithicus TaxID=1535204 RepID=A0ABW5BVN3_9BACI|nr:YhcN/YlaJ family sporulation lipoprotein [Metabacillus endolithicus]UPG63142.1 YhcN/YlaJ family sporulation lipoprotein [Metabacillus endolithicus]
MKFITILLLSFLIITGCNQDQGANDTQKNDGNETPINVKNSVEEHVDRKTGQEISKHLVELATQIPEVNDATAVVLGQFAVIGIDVNSKLDRNKVETIKYTVAESLMHDPYGARAIVIADADTNVRLREMANEIQEGRPVVGILDELAAIVGRVVPEVPSEILDNQQKQPTEQSKNQLNDQEEKSLEKVQQDQSNGHLNDK